MLYTCCVHISIRTSTILAVLFVSPSKIALEKFYVYCPPLLLDEIYAPAYIYKCYSSLTRLKMKRHMERVAFWETVSHAVSSDTYIKFQ